MASYGTLPEALAYHQLRGNTAWATATDPERTTALLRASEYIDSVYAARFPGYKVGRREQERQWPRQEAWDVDGEYLSPLLVPPEIEYATYEAALRELVTPGTLGPDMSPTANIVKERVKAGPVETETQYGGNPSGFIKFTVVDRWINNLLGSVATNAYFAVSVRG